MEWMAWPFLMIHLPLTSNTTHPATNHSFTTVSTHFQTRTCWPAKRVETHFPWLNYLVWTWLQSNGNKSQVQKADDTLPHLVKINIITYNGESFPVQMLKCNIWKVLKYFIHCRRTIAWQFVARKVLRCCGLSRSINTAHEEDRLKQTFFSRISRWANPRSCKAWTASATCFKYHTSLFFALLLDKSDLKSRNEEGTSESTRLLSGRKIT